LLPPLLGFEIQPVFFLTGRSFENLYGPGGYHGGLNADRGDHASGHACRHEYRVAHVAQPDNFHCADRAALDVDRA